MMNMPGEDVHVESDQLARGATDPFDRNPYRHVPEMFCARSEAWLSSATNLVSATDPYRYMSIENLMFAERPILEMETRLARPAGKPAVSNEPWLIMECSASSIFWLFGLYEVTRGMKSAANPRFPRLAGLHKKLEVLRMPVAKHEIRRQDGTSHYPTSLWHPQTGEVGWQVYDPDARSNVAYNRTQLANEFLNCTGGSD
jgi:hypothetical protein